MFTCRAAGLGISALLIAALLGCGTEKGPSEESGKGASAPQTAEQAPAEGASADGKKTDIPSGEASAELQLIPTGQDAAAPVLNEDVSLDEVIEKDLEKALKEAMELEKTDPKAASQAYQALTTDYPNRYEPYHRLALYFEHIGDHEAAIALYEEAQRMNPQDAVFFNDFGWYLYSTREFDQAAAMLQKANSLAPNMPKYQTNLALATAQLGRWEDAFALLQKVSGAKSAESYCTIAAIQFEQVVRAAEEKQNEEAEKKLALARETLKKALALDPNLPAALELKKVLDEIPTLEETAKE